MCAVGRRHLVRDRSLNSVVSYSHTLITCEVGDWLVGLVVPSCTHAPTAWDCFFFRWRGAPIVLVRGAVLPNLALKVLSLEPKRKACKRLPSGRQAGGEDAEVQSVSACPKRGGLAWRWSSCYGPNAHSKRSPTLTLPSKMTDLMRTIGCKSCKQADRARFRVQIEQLLTTVFAAETRLGAASTVKVIRVCTEYALWPENGNESVVVLSDEFFTQITKNAIPIDKRAFMSLRQSPLATDLYSFLTHKASYINSKVAISTNQLMQQFGGNYSDSRDGRRNFAQRLRKAMVDVSIIYPDARATCLPGRIMLAPAKTHILPKPVDKSVDK